MNAYHNFWRRLGAGILDSLLFSPLLWWYDEAFGDMSTPSRLVSAIYYASSAGFVAYRVLMHWRFGQTIGTMITGVRVMDVSEKRNPTLVQATLRDVGLILALILDQVFAFTFQTFHFGDVADEVIQILIVKATSIWFVLEILTMFANDRRRSLQDWIAGTIVVRKKPNKAPEPTSGIVTPPAEPGVAPIPPVAHL